MYQENAQELLYYTKFKRLRKGSTTHEKPFQIKKRQENENVSLLEACSLVDTPTKRKGKDATPTNEYEDTIGVSVNIDDHEKIETITQMLRRQEESRVKSMGVKYACTKGSFESPVIEYKRRARPSPILRDVTPKRKPRTGYKNTCFSERKYKFFSDLMECESAKPKNDDEISSSKGREIVKENIVIVDDDKVEENAVKVNDDNVKVKDDKVKVKDNKVKVKDNKVKVKINMFKIKDNKVNINVKDNKIKVNNNKIKVNDNKVKVKDNKVKVKINMFKIKDNKVNVKVKDDKIKVKDDKVKVDVKFNMFKVKENNITTPSLNDVIKGERVTALQRRGAAFVPRNMMREDLGEEKRKREDFDFRSQRTNNWDEIDAFKENRRQTLPARAIIKVPDENYNDAGVLKFKHYNDMNYIKVYAQTDRVLIKKGISAASLKEEGKREVPISGVLVADIKSRGEPMKEIGVASLNTNGEEGKNQETPVSGVLVADIKNRCQPTAQMTSTPILRDLDANISNRIKKLLNRSVEEIRDRRIVTETKARVGHNGARGDLLNSTFPNATDLLRTDYSARGKDRDIGAGDASRVPVKPRRAAYNSFMSIHPTPATSIHATPDVSIINSTASANTSRNVTFGTIADAATSSHDISKHSILKPQTLSFFANDPNVSFNSQKRVSFTGAEPGEPFTGMRYQSPREEFYRSRTVLNQPEPPAISNKSTREANIAYMTTAIARARRPPRVLRKPASFFTSGVTRANPHLAVNTHFNPKSSYFLTINETQSSSSDDDTSKTFVII